MLYPVGWEPFPEKKSKTSRWRSKWIKNYQLLPIINYLPSDDNNFPSSSAVAMPTSLLRMRSSFVKHPYFLCKYKGKIAKCRRQIHNHHAIRYWLTVRTGCVSCSRFHESAYNCLLRPHYSRPPRGHSEKGEARWSQRFTFVPRYLISLTSGAGASYRKVHASVIFDLAPVKLLFKHNFWKLDYLG